jgi:hypothetical protein
MLREIAQTCSPYDHVPIKTLITLNGDFLIHAMCMMPAIGH